MWVATVLVSALIGVISTLATQTLFAVRNMQIADLNDHIGQINNIEKLAVDYWLSGGETDPDSERIKAARLRGTMHASTAFRPTAVRLFAHSFPEYAELVGDLFDQATGGHFESADREADPECAVAIIETCNKIRSKLRQQRGSLYWFR